MKMVPNASPTQGQNAQSSANGGLVFTCRVEDRFGTSGTDIMMVALDGQGDTVWTRVFGREFNDMSFALLKTDDGGYLVAGTSVSSTSTLDPLRTLLIKTNAFGDTLWTSSYLALYEGLSAIQCLDGGFLLVGNPIAGFYMVRISDQGELIWTSGFNRYEPPYFAHQFSAYSAVECADGGFLVVGGRSNGSAFLSKTSSSGILEWTKLAASSNGLLFKRIIGTNDGGFIILGGTNEVHFLMKIDVLGNVIWTKGYSPPAGGWAREVIATSDGGFAMIGGADQPSGPTDDVYFLKTNNTGDVVYSGSFTASEWDVGMYITEAPEGGYYLVGWTNSFGFNSSVFVIKTDSSGVGDCYYQNLETTESTIDINWSDIELETLDVAATEQTAGCMVGTGVSTTSLCPVGIVVHQEQSDFVQVRPNPATEQFTIIMHPDQRQSNIEVFNVLGERVHAIRTFTLQTTIYCSSLPRGIYLVKITSSTATVTKRIVLE
jgi:hypothetical protein